MNLRPKQAKCLDDLWDWFVRHQDGGNPIVSAAVGAGKSVMIAALAQRADREAPGTRVLVLVHQKELLEQNVERIRKVWPQASVGIYSAALGLKQLGHQITFATIGSIYKRAYDLGRIDIVMADECHLINPKDTGIWRKFLTDLGRVCPHARCIGWTGTPFRGNGVWLTAGKDALFTHIAAKLTMRELLDDHWLAPLVSAATANRVEMTDVRTAAGDYVIADLARHADKEELVESTCDEIVSLGRDRKKWLVFAVNVQHAEHVRDALRRRGVRADIVTGETPKAERERLILAFRRGEIRCLVNVAVLTTGFDVPDVDFIALLRATKSPVLYVQIAGRGMRIADGKTDCLWADFTTTTAELGPVDAIKGRPPAPKGNAEAPFRICDNCGSRNAAGASQCVDCGFKFPEPERIKHGDQVSNAAVLSDQKVAPNHTEVFISRVDYERHLKPGSNDSLRVEYWQGPKIVAREWVLLSHPGYARRRAEQWWEERSKIDAIPGSTDAALEWLAYDKKILKTPSSLILAKNGKYNDIIEYRYGDHHAGNDQADAEGADRDHGGQLEEAEERAF